MARMLMLANAGPYPLWVISCHDAAILRCPLYLRKLPQHSLIGVSALGQKQTSRTGPSIRGSAFRIVICFKSFSLGRPK
jgi:hypothetical protein